MKKHIIFYVLLALGVTGLFAETGETATTTAPATTDAPVTPKKPLGLTFRLDAFNFGNILADDYAFGGTMSAKTYQQSGYASVLPKIAYNHSFGRFAVLGMVATNFFFSDKMELPNGKTRDVSHFLTPLRLQGMFTIPLDKQNNLTLALSYRVRFPWGGFFKDLDVKHDVMPWARWMFNNETLQLYAMFQPAFYWNDSQTPNQMKNTFKIGTGIDQTFTGNNQQNQGMFGFTLKKIRLYGYLAPTLVFYDEIDGKSTEGDFMPSLGLAIGYKIDKFDFLLSMIFPTGSKAGNTMETKGITIDPRISYSIMKNFSVYADFSFDHIGASEKAANGTNKLAITPSIGLVYSL
ncbi:MAG: hypothetical protein LBM77_09660 [Spirochaetaceae bacterium]|jgi:hypothetical protein|nr:hypothetical protein [Spirochaetaceae bacterium]